MTTIINLPYKENNNLFMPFIYAKVFTPDECQQIINFSGEMVQSPVQASADDLNSYEPSIRNSYSKPISLSPETSWMFKRKVDVLVDANNRNWNFIIDSLKETQILKYENEGFFNKHVDIGTGVLSMRKISLVLFLSDRNDYEGGQLVWDNIPNIYQEQGALVLFPSYMSHTVTKITSGTRYTMVSWAYGPYFR